MIKREKIIEIAGRQITSRDIYRSNGLRHVEMFFARGDTQCCPVERCSDCRELFPRTKVDSCPCHVYSHNYLRRAALFAARVLREEGLI
jgi:hypothetical protein